MATLVHGKDSALYLGKYALTNYLKSWEPTEDYDVADVSVMGKAYHESIPGQRAGSVKVEGFAGFAAGESMDILTAYRGLASVPLTISFPATAVGDEAILLNGFVNTTSNPADVSSAVGLSAELMGVDGLDWGKLLHVLATETATADGTSVNNGGASSNGGSANIHVTATTGASPSTVVKVQDSADDSSWADIITFTTITAATYEHKTLAAATAVRQYVRIIWTLGGSTTNITFCVAFARR